jgi:hypothetical protein
MLEGLRYYFPALLTTVALIAVGGVFLAILWLLVLSHRLRSQREDVPKGLFTLTSAVFLPPLVLAILKLILRVVPLADSFIYIAWWASLIGTFAVLLATRNLLRKEAGLISDIAASGTFVLLCLLGLGVCLQIAAFFMN